MIVFVQSYPNLLNTLYLLTNSFIYEKVIVYVINNRNLYKFLEISKKHFTKKIDIRFINEDEISFVSIYDFIKSFIQIKLSINRISNKIKHENSDIFFFSRAFTTLGFFLVKKTKKNNQLIYIPDPGCDVYKLSDSKPNDFKEFILILIYKFLYGKELVFGNAGKKLNIKYFFKISDKYFFKIADYIFTIEERRRLQSQFNLEMFANKNQKKYSVVYFDKDMLRDKLCNEFLYKNEIIKIFDLLKKYIAKKDLAKKYKPGRTTEENKSIIEYGDLIDDYIPAELLINDNVKVYLGMTSIAMANIKKGNIISLVNMVNYLDQNQLLMI